MLRTTPEPPIPPDPREAASGETTLEASSGKPTPKGVRVARLVGWCRRWEKYIPVGTFACGFIWDSLTLTRIDRMSDNLILLGYLVALAFMIVVTLRRQAGMLRFGWLVKLEPHFHWGMQFLLGGLLSSYVVFYSKSASWTQTQVFLILLVAIFVGNEFLKDRLGNPKLLAGLFMFSLFSFLTFFLPVILRSIHAWVFLLAGVLSLGVSLAVIAAAFPLRETGWLKRLWPGAVSIVFVYLLLNTLYFANLVPPVPLALKSAGIYHNVARTAGGYEVQYVPQPFYRFWKRWEDPFLWKEGEAVYCYTAVFAPGGIRVPIRHVWSEHREREGWMRRDTIAFEIAGGREGGYRGYSRKRTVTPGRWRVEVETDRGRILGRIDFTIVASGDPHPELTSHVIP